MDTNSAFWRDLEAKFRALPDPAGRLIAMLSDGQWHVYDGPNDERERERQRYGICISRCVAGTRTAASCFPFTSRGLPGQPCWIPGTAVSSPCHSTRRAITSRWLGCRTDG